MAAALLLVITAVILDGVLYVYPWSDLKRILRYLEYVPLKKKLIMKLMENKCNMHYTYKC